MDALIGGEAVAVGTDDGAGVEDAAVSDLAIVIDGDAGVEDGVVADFGVVHEGDVWIEVAVIADDDVFTDDDEGVDVGIFSDDGGRVDGGEGADADGVVPTKAVEAENGLLPSVVGFFDFDSDERGEAFSAFDGLGGAVGEDDAGQADGWFRVVWRI